MCQWLSHVQLFVVSWTVSRQVPLSMEFSRQEYLSGLPFPSPGDLPDPGIEPGSPALQADSLPFEPPGNPPSQARDGTQVSRIAGVFLPAEPPGSHNKGEWFQLRKANWSIVLAKEMLLHILICKEMGKLPHPYPTP